MLCGMLLITGIGCVISALAPNVEVLMIGRVLQGVAGPVVPLCLIMLHQRVTEDARYARLMAILTSVNGGIAGVDAILGGWLAGNFGFRSVFVVMAVVAALAVVLVFALTQESTAEETPKMDWAGVVPLGIAFLAIYLAIDEIGALAEANWGLVAILVIVAAVFFVLFWNIESRKKDPMVTTHYLKQRRTWGLLLTTLLTMTGVFAIMNGVVPVSYTHLDVYKRQVLLMLFFFVAGMEPVRAFFHGLWISISGFMTAGFTPTSQSIMYYHSYFLEIACMLLMLLGMINFGLFVAVLRGKTDLFFKDFEIRTGFFWLVFMCIIFIATLSTTPLFSDLLTMIRRGVFMLISASSTTGFSVVTTNQVLTVFSSGAILILAILMAVGGSSGSTAGGMKLSLIHI